MQKKVPLPLQADAEEFIPTYATSGASGADVRARIDTAIVIKPGKRAIIPTGLRFEIPEGYEIQVRPRSGLAAKQGITVLNTPGTIDADYRGELAVILINLGEEEFIVTPQMRIAQIVLSPVPQAEFLLREVLSATARASGGFGHTGTK
ncbi:MAG TPA: dUTP diphosphatase [Chlamydiales bacterium]|jgi:dUTP pyrophosphatase